MNKLLSLALTKMFFPIFFLKMGSNNEKVRYSVFWETCSRSKVLDKEQDPYNWNGNL